MRTTSMVAFAAICGAVLLFSSPFSSSGRVVGLASAADHAAAAQYHCPMHPTILQDRKGDCPICGMKLVPVKPPAAQAPGAAGAASAGAGAVRWRCPMHPEVVQDHEGRCPACGMKLERAPGAGQATAGAAAGAIAVAGDKRKVLGIVVAPVERSSATRTLRAFGRVAPDEARVYTVNAGVDGSIRNVAHVVTGSRVRRNQVLGSFFGPEALTTIQLFVVNNQGYDRVGTRAWKPDGSLNAQGKDYDETDVSKKNSSLYKANIQQRIMQLENLGVSALQRDDIVRDGRVPDTIWIVSPADGVVLARNASAGLKFERGFEFFRIADLRRVWVVADVFPQDASLVRRGMHATVSVPQQGLELDARVAEILPQLDPTSRTLKVRLELENPDDVLRPEMFVDVALTVDLPESVTVPADAVVDSGLAKTVYVETGEGVFEPRRVRTGWRHGDRVEIVKGLSPGERIVASGTFFLDSETRMRQPLSGAASVDGLPRTPDPTGRTHHPPGGAGQADAPESTHAEAARGSAGDAR